MNRLQWADPEELVRTVGDTIGYGYTMQLCERIWGEKDGRGGQHTHGPAAMFMVPCPHPVEGRLVGCDYCCGSGRVTKGVLALLQRHYPELDEGANTEPGHIRTPWGYIAA